MAHAEQRAFFASVKARFPAAFSGVRVLDCGSLDVNGSLRDLFEGGSYVGVDLRAGRNVDVQSTVHALTFADGSFDTVVSAEMLEHDEHWRQSLATMHRLLSAGGLLVLSMATTGRDEHGTEAVPDVGTDGDGIWGSSPDYYRPLTEADLTQAFGSRLRAAFRAWQFMENTDRHDLYFWGLTQ